MVRANHPLLLRALDRRQSATSLVKLLRDPLGYLWTYGFRWTEPEDTDEPLTLDALAFGKALVISCPSVEARLFYPRMNGQLLPLNDPEGTLVRLAKFLAAAAASFSAGNTLSGPAAEDPWYDLAFALPGGAKESYLLTKLPLAAQTLSNVEPLWGEP